MKENVERERFKSKEFVTSARNGLNWHHFPFSTFMFHTLFKISLPVVILLFISFFTLKHCLDTQFWRTRIKFKITADYAWILDSGWRKVSSHQKFYTTLMRDRMWIRIRENVNFQRNISRSCEFNDSFCQRQISLTTSHPK